jgi:dTDP-4-amino-4,6-dideoxygalactose transaminase
VIAAVIAAGCTPHFVDIDPVTAQVPLTEWEGARASGASAAIVVHLFGNGADVSEVRTLFPDPDCLVIDDAAQALGTRWRGDLVGTGGDLGLLSFGYSKQLDGGGAAVLTSSPAVVAVLVELQSDAAYATAPEIQGVREAFRQQLDGARARLAVEGRHAAEAFEGLLDAYGPALHEPLTDEAVVSLTRTLPRLDEILAQRRAKADLWSELLADTPLEPVGMGPDAVPWRYTCRLPGLEWADQHRIAEEIRGEDVPVSTWYLPGQWFVNAHSPELPGAERLSREVFQFWVDPATGEDDIVTQASRVREVISRSRWSGRPDA